MANDQTTEWVPIESLPDGTTVAWAPVGVDLTRLYNPEAMQELLQRHREGMLDLMRRSFGLVDP